MKIVRFASVVEKAGVPETHLLLANPEQDLVLQTAIKAQRVMTIFQPAVGTKADRGEIGFQKGKARQFLIFPKSLRPFAGREVVGIKYELFEGGVAETEAVLRAVIPPRNEASGAEAGEARSGIAGSGDGSQ